MDKIYKEWVKVKNILILSRNKSKIYIIVKNNILNEDITYKKLLCVIRLHIEVFIF